MYMNPWYVDSISYIYILSIHAVNISVFDYTTINLLWIHSPSIQRICLLNIFHVCSDVANHSDRDRQCHIHDGRVTRDKNMRLQFFSRWNARAGRRGIKARGERRISGVGYVTHEPPLRMAERSPAAKQSIYAFKMAAKNATHPTPRLPLPRSTYTALTPPSPPFSSRNPSSHPQASPPSSSLHPSHVCPRSSLTSEPSHWLPTSQYYPCRPRGCSLSLSLSFSLVLSWIHPLLPSRLLSFIFYSSLSTFFISLGAFLFFLFGYLFCSPPTWAGSVLTLKNNVLANR